MSITTTEDKYGVLNKQKIKGYKLQSQISEIMQILQVQKQEYLKDKMSEHQELVKKRQDETLHYLKNQTYSKQTAVRKPFLSRPKNDYEYFEKNKSKYLKIDSSFPDKDMIYFMLPDRAKDNKGFHMLTGNDSSSANIIGKVDVSKMGPKEKRRYEVWEEIRKQREKEQQQQTYLKQDGTSKKQAFYDSKLITKSKIFQPSDSRNQLFTINPSSVYDVPRTPRSTRRLIQLNRNIERDYKWNPNISVLYYSI